MNRLGKLMTMMHPEKTKMVAPEEALPGRSEPAFEVPETPRRPRDAAEAAVPGGDRGRLLRARLLLGRRAAVLGTRRRLHDGGRLHERDHAEPDLRGGLQRRRPATPRRCWSPSTRRRSPTPTCSRSSSRSTTRPRACARATTSAPSTAPASTSPTTPRRRPRRWRCDAYDEALRAAGHEPVTTEIEPAGALLLRRGLPPAVPAQGAERLLRPGRDRRLLPHPRRRVLDRGGARRARRIASRARDPLLRLLHRRLPRRDRHRRGARPRRLLAAALDRAGILRRPGAARRRDDRGRAAGRLARAARHAQHPQHRLDRRRLHRRRPAAPPGSAGAKAPARAREVAAPRVQTIALLIALGVASCTVAEWTFPSQLEPRLRHVRRRHHLVPHALRGADRPGTLDGPPALHRPAAAGRLVLPAELGADPRRRRSSSSRATGSRR